MPFPGILTAPFPGTNEPIDVADARIRRDRPFGWADRRVAHGIGVVNRDAVTVEFLLAHAPQRLPDDRRLAGLARTGDGDDPGWKPVVSEDADEVVDPGTLESNHEITVTYIDNPYNK